MLKSTLTKALTAFAVVAFLVGSNGAAVADVDTQIHGSQEIYYSTGGTEVNCEAGTCIDFEVGDITGTVLWQVTEKGWILKDTGQTLITYTVHNDTYNDPITSFHVPVWFEPKQVDTPADWGWEYVEGATQDYIVWTAGPNKLGGGIVKQESKDSFRIYYDDPVKGISFAPGVMIDVDHGTPFTSPTGDWVVSTIVPVPAAVVLGAMGLGLVAWMRRRSE